MNGSSRGEIIKMRKIAESKLLLDLLLLGRVVARGDLVNIIDYKTNVLAAVCRHSLGDGHKVLPLW